MLAEIGVSLVGIPFESAERVHGMYIRTQMQGDSAAGVRIGVRHGHGHPTPGRDGSNDAAAGAAARLE